MADSGSNALPVTRGRPSASGVQLQATTLLDKCMSGNLAGVQAILGNEGLYVNLEEKMSNGWTALQVATHYKHLEVARLLVENGAKLDVTGGPGAKSLLYIAVEGGRVVEAREASSIARPRAMQGAGEEIGCPFHHSSMPDQAQTSMEYRHYIALYKISMMKLLG